jgi:hypothetical protein
MTEQPPPSPRTTFVCGLLAVGMGLLLVLIGFGVIKPGGKGMHAPLWIATCAGLVFMLAGISIAVGAIHGVSSTGELPKDAGWWSRLFYYALGLLICAGLAAIGSWVAFGPGPRVFSGTGMTFMSKGANELIGRIVFGFGAVVTWLILLAFAVTGARKLRRRG